MKKVDREELHRQSQRKKGGTAKGPPAPNPRKTPPKLISHDIRRIISNQQSKESREVDDFLDAQDISASIHRNSSFPVTTLSTNGSTSSEASAISSEASTDCIGPAPPPLAASAPRAPQKVSKLSSRGYSQRAEQSRGGEEDET